MSEKKKIETIETDSFSMRFFRFGNGQEPLVILPGLSVQSVMGSAELVADEYRLLADDFTLYLFDRREELPESYSISEMAEDTVQALRSIGLDEVYLFGASQGGMIAMEIAVCHPEMVKKLILGSSAACVGDVQYKVLGDWVRLAEKRDAKGLYLAFGEAAYPESIFEQSHQLLSDLAETVTEEDMSRFVILTEGTKGFDITNDLGKITCPVLVIGDRDDRVLGGESSEIIKKNLAGSPDAQLFMYDGCGHAAYDTAPDYRERMLKFLK